MRQALCGPTMRNGQLRKSFHFRPAPTVSRPSPTFSVCSSAPYGIWVKPRVAKFFSSSNFPIYRIGKSFPRLTKAASCQTQAFNVQGGGKLKETFKNLFGWRKSTWVTTKMNKILILAAFLTVLPPSAEPKKWEESSVTLYYKYKPKPICAGTIIYFNQKKKQGYAVDKVFL